MCSTLRLPHKIAGWDFNWSLSSSHCLPLYCTSSHFPNSSSSVPGLSVQQYVMYLSGFWKCVPPPPKNPPSVPSWNIICHVHMFSLDWEFLKSPHFISLHFISFQQQTINRVAYISRVWLGNASATDLGGLQKAICFQCWRVKRGHSGIIWKSLNVTKPQEDKSFHFLKCKSKTYSLVLQNKHANLCHFKSLAKYVQGQNPKIHLVLG